MQQNLNDAARAAFEFEMLQENIIDDEGLERDDDTGEYIDEPAAAAWKAWIVVNDKAARASQHPDDVAVDRFALAMKAKLADARAKGRSGWDDPAKCSVEYLAQLLVGHIGKDNAGNFEDVANLAMMLHQRGADPSVLAEAAREKPAPEPVAHVKRGTNASFIDSTGCKTCWEDLPDGTALYAKPQAAASEEWVVPVLGLIALAQAVSIAMDDSEERQGDEGRVHLIDSDNFDEVCNALEALEGLPDDKPGYTLGPAGKAEWALRGLLNRGEKQHD